MKSKISIVEDRFVDAWKDLDKTESWKPKNPAEEQLLADAVVVFCEETFKRVHAQREAGETPSLFDMAAEALALRLVYVPIGNENWNTVLPFPFMPKSDRLAKGGG